MRKTPKISGISRDYAGFSETGISFGFEIFAAKIEQIAPNADMMRQLRTLGLKDFKYLQHCAITSHNAKLKAKNPKNVRVEFTRTCGHVADICKKYVRASVNRTNSRF